LKSKKIVGRHLKMDENKKQIEFEKNAHSLPAEGFLRVNQIVGSNGDPAIIPISKSSWWAGVRDGRFPKPIKLGKRTTVWKVTDIRRLIESEVI
jgi:predicted DNA-binding transcriptional regulator AlpA